MEANNRDERHQENGRHQNPQEDQIVNNDGYNVIEESNKDVAGRDRSEEHRDQRRHHQAHGIKDYESFTNRSSADDQPMTDTGA